MSIVSIFFKFKKIIKYFIELYVLGMHYYESTSKLLSLSIKLILHPILLTSLLPNTSNLNTW